MRLLWCGSLLVLLLCGLRCGTAGAGEEGLITTDGRLIRGTVKTIGPLLKVETAAPRRDVYLSPVVVSERLPDASSNEAEPSFLFHTDLTGGKRQGTIALVVDDFRWGTWQPGGTTTVSMRDPVLGAVEFRVVITRVTPRQVEMQGVEYDWVRSFPAGNLDGLVLPMIEAQVRQNPTPAQWLQFAAFHRLRGDRAGAERAIEEARRAGADAAACDAERSALNAGTFLKHLDELDEWLATGREEDAFREAALLEIPSALQKSDPLRYRVTLARLSALKDRAARQREALEQLSKRALPFLSLSPLQTDRLERVLRQGPDRMDEKVLPDLCREWAEGLAQCKWDAQSLSEAVRLAQLVEAYFADGDLKATAQLAAELSASRLPQEVKLSLLRYASRFPDAPAEAVGGWQKVEFRLSEAARAFHYFISVPPRYRPDVATPVLIALHGQHSTAEVMNRIWGEHAAREGWILISPEYIYGREWGYHFSGEEHLAVLGALQHASGHLHIDADRVFLTGVSQGGHAAWDIGPAHAGVFAAVVPIIGAPLVPAHWPNFNDTSVYAIDGSLDGPAPQMNRRGIEALARQRVDATYVEYIDRGHEGFGEEYDTVCDWLRMRRRARCPEVNLVAFRNVETRRRWIEIKATHSPLAEGMEGALKPVTVQGRIKLNSQIELKTTNVARLRILMPAEQVDLSKPLSVSINGRPAWRGTVRVDWGLALRECLTRRDRCDIFLGEIVLDVR